MSILTSTIALHCLLRERRCLVQVKVYSYMRLIPSLVTFGASPLQFHLQDSNNDTYPALIHLLQVQCYTNTEF